MFYSDINVCSSMDDWTGYVYVMKDNGYKYKIGCSKEQCKKLQQIHQQPGEQRVCATDSNI